jgi:hypothetical protein
MYAIVLWYRVSNVLFLHVGRYECLRWRHQVSIVAVVLLLGIQSNVFFLRVWPTRMPLLASLGFYCC